MLVAPPNFASPNTSFEFNLEKAAALLLNEAGWIDGNSDGVREGGRGASGCLPDLGHPLRQKTQEIIKQALELIGFRIELKAIDSTVYFSNDPANTDTFHHFYADLQLYTAGNSSADPGDFMQDFTCAEIAQKANNWAKGNPMRWCNPR